MALVLGPVPGDSGSLRSNPFDQHMAPVTGKPSKKARQTAQHQRQVRGAAGAGGGGQADAAVAAAAGDAEAGCRRMRRWGLS